MGARRRPTPRRNRRRTRQPRRTPPRTPPRCWPKTPPATTTTPRAPRSARRARNDAWRTRSPPSSRRTRHPRTGPKRRPRARPGRAAAPLVRFVLARGGAGVSRRARRRVGRSRRTRWSGSAARKPRRWNESRRPPASHARHVGAGRRQGRHVTPRGRGEGAGRRGRGAGGALLRSMDEFERAAVGSDRRTRPPTRFERAPTGAMRGVVRRGDGAGRLTRRATVRRDRDDASQSQVGRLAAGGFSGRGRRRSRLKAERLAQRGGADRLVAARTSRRRSGRRRSRGSRRRRRRRRRRGIGADPEKGAMIAAGIDGPAAAAAAMREGRTRARSSRR